MTPRSLTRAIRTAGAVLVMGPMIQAGANGTPIDDFEQGSFGYVTQTSTGGTQGGLSPLHCIAPVRDVVLSSHAGEFASAQLDLASPAADHEVATVFGDGGGRLTFRYALPVEEDLTAGGQFGVLFVYMPTAVSGAELLVTTTDITGVSATAVTPVVGPSFYLFPFSDFGGVDLTRVIEVRVTLDTPVLGDFHIRDIRLGAPDMLAPVRFQTLVGEMTGPPYPTAPILFGGHVAPPGEAAFQLERVGVGLFDATDPVSMSPLALMGLGEDSEPGAEAGSSARVALSGAVPDAARVELFATLTDAGVYHFALVGGGTPILASEDGFILPLVHRVTLGDGSLVGTVRHEILVEVAAGAPYLMSEVMMTSMDDLRVRFLLTRDLARGAGDDSPIVEIRVTGDFAEGAAVGVPSAGAGARTLFRAIPSVTARGASFTFVSPLERHASIALYDVAGRNVVTLAVPAGRQSVSWDGRDRAGHELAPGVYLARLTGGAAGPTARIVKIR